ncbi:MAG: hypothetical protein KC613_08985 [Myxococcales bacterium]|nr:hypothetical protein [Myxococcales bacterium]
MRGTTMGLVGCLLAGLGLGCDDGGEGGGGVGPAGPCQAVGDPIALPAASRFKAAAHGDGYLVVAEEGGFGSGQWGTTVIGADGQTTHVDGAPGRDPLALVGGEVALGLGLGTRFDFEEEVAVRAFASDGWAAPAEGFSAAPPAEAELFNDEVALALGADGTLVVAWSAGRPTLEGSQVWVHLKRPGEPLGAAELVFAPMVGVRDTALHLAVAADGAVHLGVTARTGDTVSLLHKVREVDGRWVGPAHVGPVPDAVGNATMTGLVGGPAGVFAMEAHGADYAAGTDGATVFYRLEGEAWAELGRVGDDRPVVVGASAAALPDGVVAAVGYGQNNLDYQESRDTVELLRCSPAGCGRALVVAPTPGVFYDNPVVVTRGDAGLVVWAAEGKGPDGVEATWAQRFRCPAAE